MNREGQVKLLAKFKENGNSFSFLNQILDDCSKTIGCLNSQTSVGSFTLTNPIGFPRT